MPETELHKLIRYGQDFELERQMRDVADMRKENRGLRQRVRAQKRRGRKRKRRP